jgi:hypothetical protein
MCSMHRPGPLSPWTYRKRRRQNHRQDGRGRQRALQRKWQRSLFSGLPIRPSFTRFTLAAGEDKPDRRHRLSRYPGGWYTRILLNGKAIFLQGANMHAEAPVRGGRAYSQEDADTIFGYLKEMHANFVRLAHYPHDERMERTADRDGILVWSEIPNWQHISFDKPEVYAKAVSMLREMIRRDRNKASVILWSVSNETPNNPDAHQVSDRPGCRSPQARRHAPDHLRHHRTASQRHGDGAGRPAVRCARRRSDRTNTSAGTT